MSRDLAEYVRKGLAAITGKVNGLTAQLSAVEAKNQLLEKIMASAPRSITQEIDKIQGRRIFYNLNGVQDFSISDDGRRGQPINFLVSQDGPFIMTHFPMVSWLPTQPTTATNRGLWRPVCPYPLPAQASGGAAPNNLNEDIISISYELIDGGSQRNFQNLPTPPVLSTPLNMVPLPVPTLWTPNSTIQFHPTYNRILFNNQVVAPTQGQLVVALPGYRIVNM